MVCLGLESRGKEVGADKSTELWRHPLHFTCYLAFFNPNLFPDLSSTCADGVEIAFALMFEI